MLKWIWSTAVNPLSNVPASREEVDREPDAGIHSFPSGVLPACCIHHVLGHHAARALLVMPVVLEHRVQMVIEFGRLHLDCHFPVDLA